MSGGTHAGERRLSMADLVRQTGVGAPTIRYYLTAGLLPPPVRVASNRFWYDERHVEVIRLVRLLRERRGLSLEAIGRALPELLPDLHARPEAGAFRPQMWGQLLAAHTPPPRAAAARDRLVEAGLVAFAARGVGEVTVDDLARAAGIAKGSFYRHFPSKDALFFAAAQVAGRRMGAAYAEATAAEPVERARAVGLLASAMGPFLPLLLDLAGRASQRRAGYAAALRDVVRLVREPLQRGLLLAPGEHSRDGFGAALVEAITRVTGEDAELAPIVATAATAAD